MSRLQSKTAAVPSSYTQAGPRTGVPEPDQTTALLLAGSGTQDADSDLEILTQRAGGVGYEAAGYVWRSVSDGDTTSKYKGWDGPQIATGWETLRWSLVATGQEIRASVIRLASGRLLAAYDVSPLGVIGISRYAPSTGTWTSCNLAPTGAGAGYATHAACLVQLPSGRVICYCTAYDTDEVDAYYSDDDGDTWDTYAHRVIGGGAYVGHSITSLAAAYSAGEVLLIVCTDDGLGTLSGRQYASSDLGLTVDLVLASWFVATAEMPYSADVIPLAGGGFLLTYHDAPIQVCYSRRLGSAWQALDTADRIAIDTLASPDMAAWRDEDGVIYALVGLVTDQGHVLRTVDEGATWEDFDCVAGLTLSGSIDWTRFAVQSIAGRTAMVTRWTAPGSTYDSQSVAVIWLGGYSTHTVPNSYEDYAGQFRDPTHLGWGSSAGGRDGGLYLPATVPGSANWTPAGAGSEAQTAAAELEVTTAAGQTRYYERTPGGGGEIGAFIEAALEIDAGDGSLVAEEITLRLRLSCSTAPPGIFELDFELRFSSAGYQVYDRAAAANVGAAVAYDLTTLAHVRIAVDSAGNLRTWHGRGGHVRSWTAGTTGTLTVAGYTNPTLIRWGHCGAAANVSRWTMVGYAMWPGRWTGSQVVTAPAAWSNPACLHRRSYATSPALVYDGVRLAALGGPTRYGETQRIATRYDCPVSAVLPEIDPCPRVPWRSLADEADMYLVFDLGGDSSGGRWLNTSIGLALLGANVRYAKLDYWTGAAWTTVATLDAASGWATLPYRRDGDVIYPDPGVAAGSRWLGYGTAVGATIQLDAGTYRKILAHSEGAWEDSATKRPWIRIELSGGEPTSGTGALILRDSCVVVHEVAVDARYWRVLIPSQITAAGYYEIGEIVLGHLVLCGYQWSRTGSLARSARVDSADWRDGQRRVTRRGPPPRVLEIAWTDGVDASQTEGTTPDPDYVSGSASGLPVAARSEGPRLLQDLLADHDGPRWPVLALLRVPRGTGSQVITDPRMLLWGRLGEEMTLDRVLGDEGVSDVERSSRVVIEEIT